jgi:hypothetical protein
LDVVECALPVVQGKAQRGGIAVAIPTSWNAAMRRWKRAIRHVASLTQGENQPVAEKSERIRSLRVLHSGQLRFS